MVAAGYIQPYANQAFSSTALIRPVINTNILPPRGRISAGSSLSIGISGNGIRDNLLSRPLAVTILNFPGENIAVISDPDEHLGLLQDISSMKKGLEGFSSCIVEGDIAGMTKAATEIVIPKMRAANIIDQTFLENNEQMIGSIAALLTELRTAQAELLKGAREKIEEIVQNPKEGAMAQDLLDFAGAVFVAAQAAEQAVVTDTNESTISEDMWRQIWEKAPEGLADRYLSSKITILEESARIAELCADLDKAINRSDTGKPEAGTQTAVNPRCYEAKKETRSTTASIQSPRELFKDWSTYLLLKALYELVEKQSEARRRAAAKREEELAEEQRLLEKKMKARIAEKKRAEKLLSQKLEAIRAFILEAVHRLDVIYAAAQEHMELSVADERERAGRDKLYFEQKAKQTARQAYPLAI